MFWKTYSSMSHTPLGSPSQLRLLAGLRLEERTPKTDSGRKHLTEIAHDVNEFRLRKHLPQDVQPRRVGRRLQHNSPRSAPIALPPPASQVHQLQEADKPSLPGCKLL